MDLRYSREVTVGTIVLVAIAIFIFGTMWLSGRSVSPGDNTVRIQFEDVSGLEVGSPVQVSGVTVGSVEEIDFRGYGNVLAWISLPPMIDPRIDATAEIVSVSLVGDYAVDFNPGSASEPLPDDQIIQGARETGLSQQGAALAERADTILLGLQEFASVETAREFRQTLGALQRTLNTLAEELPATTAQTQRTMASLAELSDQLRETLGSPALTSTLRRTDSLTANLNATTAQLTATLTSFEQLLAGMNRGQGTLGRLATDTTLYQNLVGATAALDSLLTVLKQNPERIQIVAPIKVF